MEEVVLINGKFFNISCDQVLTLEQTIYLIDEIKNIFGTEDIQMTSLSSKPRIELLAIPKEPPIAKNLSKYYHNSNYNTNDSYDIQNLTNENTKTTIVLACRNEGKLILDTVNSILNNKTNTLYEIIVVDDGSTDMCCDIIRQNLNDGKFDKNILKIVTNSTSIGACKARNLGTENSSSDTNYVCFLDAHTRVEPHWLDKLIEAELSSLGNNQSIVTCGIRVMDGTDEGGFGETLNLSELPKNNFVPLWLAKPKDITEVPFAPGGVMLIPKFLFNDIGGFEKYFQTWGAEDTEISLKAWLMGYKILATPHTKIEHFFRPKHPYMVTQHNVDFNNIMMAINHFNPERIEKMLKFTKTRTDIEKIVSQLLTSNVFEQRKLYLSKRTHDDNWFFNKFGIAF